VEAYQGHRAKDLLEGGKEERRKQITWITLDHPDILVSLNIHSPH
jgi:hypothetical protein